MVRLNHKYFLWYSGVYGTRGKVVPIQDFEHIAHQLFRFFLIRNTAARSIGGHLVC